MRVVTRLALDRLQSAQRRRETYVGPYLPEPLVADDAAAQPEAAAELADSLTLAFLVLLDELTPKERAVLLLHDVFGYPFDEVAAEVDLSPAACRQLASRTRHKLDHERGRAPAARRRARAALVGSCSRPSRAATSKRLMELLAPDVVQLGDGGPDRHAARRPVVGADRVARFLAILVKRMVGFGDRDARGERQRRCRPGVRDRRPARERDVVLVRARRSGEPHLQPAQPREAQAPRVVVAGAPRVSVAVFGSSTMFNTAAMSRPPAAPATTSSGLCAPR